MCIQQRACIVVALLAGEKQFAAAEALRRDMLGRQHAGCNGSLRERSVANRADVSRSELRTET
jgi:hypothetical protein